MPDASITADAIVAFPGETEQQYRDTLKLISEIGFEPKQKLLKCLKLRY